ncbi:uncharacterized protein TNCV_723591 [Trichonephila clavipes]|nr:uncharacterized protein TNCV_723591 [Trichonephila clavipes]
MWQQNPLSSYTHDYPTLTADVTEAVYPIYEYLRNVKLMEECVNGFKQNNYERYNQLIWKITPKTVPCHSKVVEIAAYIAAGMFNEGTTVRVYADKEDVECVMIAETRAHGSTREGRMAPRQHQLDLLEATVVQKIHLMILE